MAAPRGGRLRVTVLGYRPNVGPVSDDALAHVATLTLRIANTSSKTYRDDSPAAITVLHNSDTSGDSSDDSKTNGAQPCQRSFWARKLSLAPGASLRGCIPYHVGNNQTVLSFTFAPAATRGATWQLGKG